jgi:type II secretory pathway pseudopilin PulG
VRRVRLAGERGEGLIELLVAITIFSGVLGATLFTFNSFDILSRRTVDRVSAQDSARTAVDRLTRDLRNLASPTIAVPKAVDLATPYDLIFQTVDTTNTTFDFGSNSSHVKRERWCLKSTNDKNEILYVQDQYWNTLTPPTTVPSTACGSGWDRTTVLASNITNQLGGQSRPVFTYNSSVLAQIDEIHIDLYSDIDAVRAPNETHITSGVFLRNQNQIPIASFTAAVSGTSAIVLNGPGSYDPEGQDLKYVWYDGTRRIGDILGDPNAGTGITYTYPVSPGSSHSVLLKVYDPAGLEGVSPSQTVNVPGGSG